MAIQTGKKGRIFNEINITPLTDIFLVLLIIMMVIAPMFQAIDQDIKLPEINSGIAVEENKVTVAITKKGAFYIDSAPIDVKDLNNRLKEKHDEVKAKQDEELNLLTADSENPEETKKELAKSKEFQKIVIVKADAKTKHKEIMKVIHAAKFAGFEKLTVAGEPLSKQQQADLESNPQESVNSSNSSAYEKLKMLEKE